MERRAYSPKEKLEVVLEGIAKGGVSEVCRRRGITVKMYYRWREQLLKNAGAVFGRGKGRSGSSREVVLEERLRRKDAVIAELTQENLELKRGGCL